ncbi:hypothetical protein [Paractinoplanes hotanensis]|nr:hypothetical protein [Actinoplanes hotanensis]
MSLVLDTAAVMRAALPQKATRAARTIANPDVVPATAECYIPN